MVVPLLRASRSTIQPVVASLEFAPHPHRRPEARLCRLAGNEPDAFVEREVARVGDDGHPLAACGRAARRGDLDQRPADALAPDVGIDEEVIELTDFASAIRHDREPQQLPALADRDAGPSLGDRVERDPQCIGVSLEDGAILLPHPRRSPMQLAQGAPL